MRWRNEAEKKIVLEAAAEYNSRLKALSYSSGADVTETAFIVEHFEEWLRWYLSEEMHLQSVHAYMRATPQLSGIIGTSGYRTEGFPQSAAVQPEHPAVSQHRIAPPNFTDLLAALEDKKLSATAYKAVKDAAASFNWQPREGETLYQMAKKMRGSKMQQALVDAWQGAG